MSERTEMDQKCSSKASKCSAGGTALKPRNVQTRSTTLGLLGCSTPAPPLEALLLLLSENELRRLHFVDLERIRPAGRVCRDGGPVAQSEVESMIRG